MEGVRRERDLLRNAANTVREPEAEPEQASLIRKLQINFDELYVAAIANRIVIYESNKLRPIDILVDHQETIRAIDVAQMLRNIVSFSRGATSDESTFMVHCLVDADHIRDQEEPQTTTFRPKVVQDETVYAGRLKWKQTYHVTISAYRIPKCLGISSLGDFCVLAGYQFVALWTIDALMDSYTQRALYAKASSEDRAEVIEEVNSIAGEIIQTEVCGSGRIFITLEHDDNSLKIWHNKDTSLKQTETDVDFRRFYCEPGLIEPYILPKHRNPIQRFKILASNGNLRKVQPSILLTISRRKAFIWVESLELPDMAFSCVRSFDIMHDASFVDFSLVTPRSDLKHIDLRYECSKLFHSFKDTEKHCRKQINQDNPLGLVPSVLGGTKRAPTSIDWLLLLMENHIILTQCRGLRNVPAEKIECKQFRKIQFDSELNQNTPLTRLLTSAFIHPGKFDDIFNFLAMNDCCTNVFKCTVDIKSEEKKDGASSATISASLNAAIRVIPPAAYKVGLMLSHPSLPLVALVYQEQGLIQVYRLEENMHPAVHEGDFSLHGSYKSQSSIVDAQWVGDLDQLLIVTQQANSKTQIDLVSSTTTMKMLSLFGNKSCLQEEVNKVLGADPSQCKLTPYKKVASFATELDEPVKNLIYLSSEVRPQDQPHTCPVQTICFAVMGITGKSAIQNLTFQVDMDNAVCELSQNILHRHPSFSDDFKLVKVLATHRGISKTHVLCLSQKNPPEQIVRTNARGPIQKPQAQLHLLQLTEQEGYQCKFVAPGKAEDLLEQPVVAKFSSTMLGIQIRQGPYSRESLYLYLYSLESETYSGFLDLNKMLGVTSFRQPSDFFFLEDKIKDAIALAFMDRIYILYQKQSTWEVLLSSEKLTNTTTTSNVSLIMVNSADQQRQTLVSLHNDKVFLAHSETKILSLDHAGHIHGHNTGVVHPHVGHEHAGNLSKHHSSPHNNQLHRMIIERQRSQSLFNPSLLAELYFKGYGMFVVKILLKLKGILENQQRDKLNDYLDMDLQTLLLELKTQAKQLTMASTSGGAAPQPAKATKKQTAFSVFDDLDESDSDDEKIIIKEEEKTKEDDPQQLFKDGADALASLLTEGSALERMGLDVNQAEQLVVFVHKFKNIFQLDFHADPLASMLLRKVFFETEKVDEAVLRDEKQHIEEYYETEKSVTLDDEQKFMNYKAEEVKPFSMEEYMAVHNKPEVKSTGDLEDLSDWNSAMVCMALHSENQEVIMNYLAERFQFEKHLTWGMMKKLCIPIWLKDVQQLKKYIEIVAKTEYRINEGRPAMCKADYSAVWYTLLGKKSVLQSLYQREIGQEKFAQFFSKDFTDEKTRIVAQKNGLALCAKQKYHLACSFLLLGEKLDTAVKVALDYMQDPVLAILMCRITDPEGKTDELNSLLTKWFIQRGQKFNDPFLINIGLWLKKDYVQSINQLTPEKESGLDYFQKSEVKEFNLEFDSRERTNQESVDVAPESEKIYPLVSKCNYVLIDLLRRLRETSDVKRALNKAWANAKAPGKSGGAGSIFDDFLDSSSSSSEKEDENKEEIQVDEGLILRQSINQTLIQRQTILGLLLIEENRKAGKELEKSQVDKLFETLILDQVVKIEEGENDSEAFKGIQKGIALLAEFQQSDTSVIQIKNSSQNKKETDDFLLKQLQMFGLFKFRIELLSEIVSAENMSNLGLLIIEEQTSRIQSLIEQMSCCAGLSLTACDYDLPANEMLMKFVERLESIINCMMVLNFPQPDASGSQTASRSILKGKAIQATKDMINEQPGSAKFNGLNLSQNPNKGDNEGAADDSSDEEEAKQEINNILIGALPTKNPQFQKAKAKLSLDQDIWSPNCEHCEKEDLANTVVAKFRADLTMIMALQTLALLLSKFNLAKDLSDELKMILGISMYAGQLDSLAITEEQLQSLKSIMRPSQMKKFLLKIKRTLKRNTDFNKHPIADQSLKRRKVAKNINKQFQNLYDFIGIWFRQMTTARTISLLQANRMQEIKLLRTSLITKGRENDSKYLQQILAGTFQVGTVQTVLKSFMKLDQSLKDVETYIFSRVLKSVDQRLVIFELQQIIEERYRSIETKMLNMGYFFQNLEKFKQFATSFQLHLKHQLLEDLQLGLTCQKFAQKYHGHEEVDGALQNSLISTGIELFKQRQEPIVDICFDCTGNDMMTMAIQAKGMREISVVDTLIYRNRREGGLEMIDEDQQNWAECLHRYEPVKQVASDLKPSTDAVRAAVYSLYSNTTATETFKTIRPASALMLDTDLSPPLMWDNEFSSSYSKTYSDLRITHDDYTNAVEAHPFLPVYLSGNAKGLVCMWNFNQMTDKSLNQWMLDKETPPAQANPKKATVKRIEFSSYGDKFGALNMGGQLFLMNFDLETSSKIEPLFSTLSSARLSENKLNDFAFLDKDSIMAGVSLKDKLLNVYDSLLPPRQSLVQSHRAGAGGNLMQVCSDTYKILCFNGKPGYVTEYDLRKENETLSSKMLCKDEVTAVALSPDQAHLVLGQSDGLVKIFDMQTTNLSEKGTINAFTSINGRKGSVLKLRFHPKTGALFAASNVGCVKLLRLAI